MNVKTRDLTTAGLLLQLARLDRSRNAFYDDPMSEYAPVGDFMEDYDRKERKILSNLLDRADKTGEAHVRDLAFGRLERWMP